MSENPSNPYDYKFHPETHIHEYTLYRNGRDVVEVWFAHLDKMVEQAIEQGHTEMRLLVDVTQGGNRLPVGYMIQNAKELEKKYAHAPVRRYAVVGNNEGLGTILKPLFGILKARLSFRYFIDRERAKAIEWLTSTQFTTKESTP